MYAAVRGCRVPARSPRRRFLQHHVRVRPAEAERAHARQTPRSQPRAASAVPATGISTGTPFQSMCGFSCVEVQVRRDLLVLQRQHHLDQAGDAGRRSRWPMLVLTEPTSSGASGGAPCAEHRASACTSIGSPSAVPVPCAST